MSRVQTVLLASVLACLAGCSMFGSGEDAKLRKSPNFQMGYEDGCAAANQQGADFRDRLVQDKELYKTDDAYRTGWSNGFSTCRTTSMPAGTQPGASPIGPPPGTH